MPVSHSQIVREVHPASRSALLFRRSRCRFRKTFSIQYSEFDFTSLFPSIHFLHPCQKQPWMKTARRLDGKTMSGLPGSDFACNRNRNPFRNKNCRTAISGLVFFERIAAILARRRIVEIVSIGVPPLGHVPSLSPVLDANVMIFNQFLTSGILMHCCRPYTIDCAYVVASARSMVHYARD